MSPLALAAAIAAAGAAAPPGAAAAKRPNVLLVVTDDQRAEGTMQVMPKTRRWFGRKGTEFTSAHVTTPLCCPSRATILTGRYAHNHGMWLNNAPRPQLEQRRTVQRHLHRAGYRTGIVGKLVANFPLERRARFWDSARIFRGGYRRTRWNVNGRLRTVRRYSTAYIAKHGARFVRGAERRDRKPWFLYVATSAPHAPFEPQRKYADAPVGSFPESPGTAETNLTDKPAFLRRLAQRAALPRARIEALREGQLRTLISVDDMMGRLRRALRKGGELRRTLVIFISDNGLLWGEHGGLTIKDLPYPEATRVPLLVSWPGRVPRRAVDDRLVANVDLAPTILDAAGVRSGRPMDGRSLLDRGRRDRLLLEYGGFKDLIPPWVSLVRPGGAQYTRYRGSVAGGLGRELYDGSDPFQLGNVLGPGSRLDPAVVAELDTQLDRDQACAGASCP